jgi:hypothetical protein
VEKQGNIRDLSTSMYPIISSDDHTTGMGWVKRGLPLSTKRIILEKTLKEVVHGPTPSYS